jgi:hypothetical protein
MIHIDHIAIGSANLYEASHRLREETGLGFYDGGWFKMGIANKIFPLGEGAYIEVESVVDPGKFKPGTPVTDFFYKEMNDDHFTGLCLRVDSMEELQEVAKRHNTTVLEGDAAERIRTSGPRMITHQAPSAADTWPKGLPNWYFFEDITIHPSGQPVLPAPGLVSPLGIAWLEMGGTESQMTDWLGVPASGYPFKFNGKALGLYTVAVKSDRGEIVIHKKHISDVV